jgi:hypothetical protein
MFLKGLIVACEVTSELIEDGKIVWSEKIKKKIYRKMIRMKKLKFMVIYKDVTSFSQAFQDFLKRNEVNRA